MKEKHQQQKPLEEYYGARNIRDMYTALMLLAAPFAFIIFSLTACFRSRYPLYSLVCVDIAGASNESRAVVL